MLAIQIWYIVCVPKWTDNLVKFFLQVIASCSGSFHRWFFAESCIFVNHSSDGC